jgi:hypothetical protein
MKKIAAISAGCAVMISGLFLLFGNSSSQDTLMPEATQSQSPAKVEISQEAPVELPFADPTEAPADDDFPITKEQFESLSEDDQNQILEEFVEDFWQKELASDGAPTQEKKYISLDIFNRPYMQTITEDEFWQLSPEDREKAMAEAGETCLQIRSHVTDIVAQAQLGIADNNYVRAEAYLIYVLEVGRELSSNKEGMHITRLVGISCERNALNDLVKVYTQHGDHSKVQAAQERLRDLKMEVEEMKETAILRPIN